MYRFYSWLFGLLFCAQVASGTTVQIGNGTLINQCLPVEPLLNYSYSQSIYTSAEIGFSGNITSLGFQYRIAGTTFLSATNQFSIYLGTSSRQSFGAIDDWIPVDSLLLVFQGSLQSEWFSSSLPGEGWLTIPFNSVYFYTGNGNLIIAVDENQPGGSSMGDDFLCAADALPRSLEIHSQTVNPNPASPPSGYPGNPLSVRPNLRLEIQPVLYAPHTPIPAHNATGVGLTPLLTWQSDADSWDVYFAEANQPLQLAAQNLTSRTFSPAQSLSLLTVYIWKVVAHHEGNTYDGTVWTFTTAGETISPPLNLQAEFSGNAVHLSWQTPLQGSIVSYNIYRNLQNIANSQTTQFTDTALTAGMTYVYLVRAVNYLNQLSPPSNQVTVTIPGPGNIWQMDFDSAPDFATTLDGWILQDLDNSYTWGWSQTDFPQEGNHLSWIVFNPSQTNPPLTEVLPHNGQKMLLSISGMTPPNNDWLISPRLLIGTGAELSFWARSYTSDYGLERLRFLISVTDSAITSFNALSSEPWLAVPDAWTHYTFDLTSYSGQHVYFAWNCISWDAFALCLDDIALLNNNALPEEHASVVPDVVICPNPARDEFNIVSKANQPFDLSIYNLKGQRLLREEQITGYEWSKANSPGLKPGVYLIRTSFPNRTSTHKLLIY